MKKFIFLCCLFLLATFTIAGADTTITNNLLSSAQPDECYSGAGVNYFHGITGYSTNAGKDCWNPANPNAKTTLFKTNQTYVWGLTREGSNLWIGTGGNVVCTTEAGYLGSIDVEESSALYICEFGQSQLLRTNPPIISNAQRGDWRPPKVYQYQLNPNDPYGISGTLIDRTPSSDPLLKQVMGFRSAGSLNGVVFLAGGARVGGGIIMFAFDATTGQFLGSQKFTQYGTSSSTSIRKWAVVNNKLYTAVGSELGLGYVLRWTGSRSNPFSFVTVGRMIGLPRELAQYTDNSGRPRLAITAQGLYLSPAITSSAGLPQSSAFWTMIWTPWNYEPDYETAYGYGGGSLRQFDGWLYWGTMHIPGRGAYLHSQPSCTNPQTCFGEPQTPEEENILNAGTARATSIWRGRNLESASTREIQLLYGESELPAYDPATRTFPLTSTGWTPLYGHSGFEDASEGISPNSGNGYTWTMEVAFGKLLVGTLDLAGADLWRFDSSSVPAKREDRLGLNTTGENYGIRTMVPSADGNTLYAGMASYSNLGPYAGWELHALTLGAFGPVIPAINVNGTAVTSPYWGAFVDTASVTVSLSITTPGASIRYTLDGTEPSESSPLYEAPLPIELTQTTTLKARGFLEGTPPSGVATAKFTKVDFTLSNGGDISVGQASTVENTINGELTPGSLEAMYASFSRSSGVSGLPAGATVRFSPSSCYLSQKCSTTLRIDTGTQTIPPAPAGFYPLTVTGKVGTSPLTVAKTTTFNLTVTASWQVAIPAITPNGGEFIDQVIVSLSTTTPGASIRYTLDGSDPTESSSLYDPNLGISLDLAQTGGQPTTLKAIGFLAGYLPSGVASAEFTIIAPPVTP